jgi:uncharacterized membrane protein YbhN (UPF0104 family)
VAPVATLGDSFRSFFDAIDQFFDSLGAVRWGPLILAVLCYGIYLTVRSRASYNVLRAAYPTERFGWKEVWGAFLAGYGVNAIIPARPGDIVRLFLTKTSIPNSSYAAVGAASLSELIFDWSINLLVILPFAFSQGVFPKPPDFARLNAFDLSYFASHPQFTLFLLTALGVAVIAGTALLSVKVRAFWARVKQGLTILTDRRRYFREVWLVQFGAWLFRFATYWFMLEAFNIGASVHNVLLVMGVMAVSAVVPFTPGGAGVQQALLVEVFAGSAAAATVAAYSVGQHAAIAAFSAVIGFATLFFVFRIRSFREAVERGRVDREADDAAQAGRQAGAEAPG